MAFSLAALAACLEFDDAFDGTLSIFCGFLRWRACCISTTLLFEVFSTAGGGEPCASLAAGFSVRFCLIESITLPGAADGAEIMGKAILVPLI